MEARVLQTNNTVATVKLWTQLSNAQSLYTGSNLISSFGVVKCLTFVCYFFVVHRAFRFLNIEQYISF